MIREAIQKLVRRDNLSLAESEAAFAQIMQGQATPAQIGAFITALRMKGETVDEITGAARIMRRMAVRINVDSRTILDTCGTGGDENYTVNISTLAALIACAAGVTVAKHGNRSVSGKIGSADLLENLGVNLTAEPQRVEECVRRVGIAFLFAPAMHHAMKHAGAPRKEIGIRTIFNILGPLTNPAGATHQLLGVFSENLLEPLAEVLGNLGAEHAVIVHGRDGLDELSTTAETDVAEFRAGKITRSCVSPEQFGLTRTTLAALQVHTLDDGVARAKTILQGDADPARDIVLLNAGVALYAADQAPSIADGLSIARRALDSGAAWGKLELLAQVSNARDT
ncbi:MAG: anthranilate phosphoribosyltransferase [Candidatus Omnitrophica bacterium]|nr:anthranilate phosphoribosyltransferase [Candidatus Omnitrophota bacterium]